ncbi:glucose-6-phosphate dehydrogenase [Epibacterium sp. DP7N7-1]|jgi:glucose-6-phosphate 1-dehydrogenase|uniref:glucose-6-phosphate dehydrogenase n=1 Tax=Tritonibacter TaxID=2083206 RepID=UPI000806D0A1|nr:MULTISPECIES: glucose-6-phosphate dehydrogenase [Tritonibacter]MBW3244151.1 glucose-6-phosphate dehydrogenase [Epibacterium sp. DP7N7-1]NKX74419.1 glucose-6-phosphate dehydrogenase [Rhodobacteraceae bacterium R_SAG3]PXW81324.1 glucose-6-phosphate 1-dehydrogenase [Ruegeria sp. P4]MCA2007715.1 glucose-6-phosphate dehydrogenase [Tritonibacter mobilis]NHM17952.1 glucose-6-phosphate dehydrogenase [Tritonibacter mobilis]
MVSRVIPVDSFDFVLFGATGDLARRKILPSLFHRFQIGQFDDTSRIIGASRSKMDQGEFQTLVGDALKEFGDIPADAEPDVERFLALLDYASVDAKGDGGWSDLGSKLRNGVVRAFYLSVAPSLFGDIAGRLKSTGIADDLSRIVVEKPFGHDLASAQALNAALREHFEESQIYRIDHYLGKETVQNLMALRFANSLFEPQWNSHHIDHVQITVSESISVAGRGEYYDKSGAMRDMVQNHLMQLLCLTAMEPPSTFEPNAVRNEKLKVIESLEPVPADDIVRGQYRAKAGGDGYLDHAGDPHSRTESFVAMKVEVANWRWAGTPFYLRTGKCLRERVSEIAVYFRKPPHNIFGEDNAIDGNMLVIRLQPDEGITLKTTIKDPGPGGMRLTSADLDMTFADSLPEAGRPQDAYERLIMDVIRGNQTLFMRGDEVEAAWTWADPIINAWDNSTRTPQPYDQGGSGPEDALLLLHRDGRRWRAIGA